jgi:phosphoglycerate dehydrogenase-like enzyme
MKDTTPIGVTSRSFSRHELLRAELLERYENVSFNDAGVALAGEELVAFLADKTKAIMALEQIDDALLERLPALRLISKFGVGLDSIDLTAVERHGVRLVWTPGTNSRSVSELALSLTLIVLHRIVEANRELRDGQWRQLKGACLTGRTVGIVGFGNAGQDLARLLQPFRCTLLTYDLREAGEIEVELGVEHTTLDELLIRSDVVSVHLELNESTRNLLDERRLGLLSSTAVLVNTSRGGLIDEDALKRHLVDGKLAGAAFDVFSSEPVDDSELLALPNFVGTPHIGGSTEDAIRAMGRAAIEGLDPEPLASV